LTDACQNGQPWGKPENSLFDRFPWLYAFCRDHLFRDDTKWIAAGLWPTTAGVPPAGSRLLELGCGPGFYARRLGETFGHLDVTGVDRSDHQLKRARMLAALLQNCSFEQGDARALSASEGSFDAVVASRLFVVLPGRERALAEAHRVLKPGGRLFIAEPRSALRAAVPLRAMRLLAFLETICGGSPKHYREPSRAYVMDAEEFGELVGTQPWKSVRHTADFWYQYAVCEKVRE
jgi:ubiquinone/menaquinone biosynthesis C-methylase UbiE